MNEQQLRELTNDFLVPFLAGVRLEEASRHSVTRGKLVALEDPCTILFKAQAEDEYRLALRRKQPFDKVRPGSLNECNVVEAFVDVVQKMQFGLKNWYKADLRSAFPRRVVARALCKTEQEQETLLAVIDQFSEWAGREYEGKPIPAAIGLIRAESNSTVSFSDVCKQDFSAVLSNGFDTLLTLNLNGEILDHEILSMPPVIPTFAPHRLAAVAAWADEKRIAITLNRSGEIMIFNDHKLRFTRRGGHWHFLTHKPVLRQMGRPDKEIVRQAIYETCLDASFARTGACIGVVTSNHKGHWKKVVTSPDDYLENPISVKSKTISAIIGQKKFYELDRRLRQELVAIDGATVLDHEGTVLAVGAILRISGGSTGGGRLAAAKALSSLGMGVKVSQDGGIRGFHDNVDDPRFQLM